MEKLSAKPISNRGAFCNYSLAPRTEICKTFVKQRTKNVPETSSKTLLPRLNFKTGHLRSVVKKISFKSSKDDLVIIKLSSVR